MPKALDQEKQEILKKYWSEGMTSTGDKDAILKASKEAKIDIIKVKQWIGNERKRRGQAKKRGVQKAKDSAMLPCKTRKTSAYQMFKSDFLKTNLAKTLRQSYGEGELQRRANALWKEASQVEKEEYARKAEEANQNPQSVKLETRRTRVKKLTSLIQECVDQLNVLGCPSLWIGHIDGTPERYFAKGVGQLANDETFTNYTVSSLINSVAKEKMEAAKSPSKESKAKRRNKRRKTVNAKDSEGGTQTPSAAPVASSEPVNDAAAGSLFQLMDASGKAVATGEQVARTQIHGRDLGPEWLAFRVTQLLIPSAKPWPAFPTHSGEVEEGSFIAWPKNKTKRPQPRAESSKSAKETRSLMYPNHPNYGVSPSVLLQRPRHTRQKQ